MLTIFVISSIFVSSSNLESSSILDLLAQVPHSNVLDSGKNERFAAEGWRLFGAQTSLSNVVYHSIKMAYNVYKLDTYNVKALPHRVCFK